VLDPAIVMFDEPDSGLDPVRTALLCELIREVHEENGGCYLVISHDLGTARRIADFLAVLWKGRIVESGPANELFDMRKKFGLLFQDGALFGSMNVFDNTAFPLRQHTDKSEEEIGEICNRRLREVGLAEATQKMPNELSGGMRKRAGFARALVLDPAIVMFDEPDSGLDPVRTALLCELIREVHAENGGCYLVISHDLGTARRIADFLAVLWKGRIVESGPADELFNSDNEFVAQFLNAETEGPLARD
jgi:phospholipid/cholesterol/gamma-HCH transport system ATP-binding protein